MIAAPTVESNLYSSLMTLKEHDEGRHVNVETLESIQRDMAAVSVSDMESGVNVVSQTLREPQARKRLHQLAEQARDSGIANSAHAEPSSAAASSSGHDSYGAEVRLSNLVIRM